MGDRVGSDIAPTPIAPCGFEAGKLWSLWDMLVFNARPFANLLLALAKNQEPLTLHSDRLPDNTVYAMNSASDEIASHCDELDLPVSAEMARNGLKGIKSFLHLRLSMNQMMNTLLIELNNRKFYAPTRNMWKYFENSSLFGGDVFANFPSANEDIQEAGTCLSLDRATACVMHLNRALEVSLLALANAVGVTKKNDWGAYIREIAKELDARMKSSGVRSHDEQFYAEALANFDRLRHVYRNPTMHPEKTYSIDRAEEILLATKAFMSHLATHLKE